METKKISELVTEVNDELIVDEVKQDEKAKFLMEVFTTFGLAKFEDEWFKIDSIDRCCIGSHSDAVMNLLIEHGVRL